MKETVKNWLTYLDAQAYSPNTLELYGGVIREFFRSTGAKPLADVTPDTVEKWMLIHKDWAPATRKWNYAAVHSFFKYCVNKKLIADDPSSILPSTNVRKHIDESKDTGKEDRVYTTEQLKGLMEFDDVRDRKLLIRDRAIIALMAATGMRASEVCWLNVSNIIKRQGNTIFALRKGQNIRKITVSDFAFPYLNEYLDMFFPSPMTDEEYEETPLFATRTGKRINRHDVYNLLSKRQHAQGIRTGTHNIRYTVINAVERHANAVVARDIAGQKSIAITNNYLVSNENERADAMSSLPWAETMKEAGKSKTSTLSRLEAALNKSGKTLDDLIAALEK